MEYFIGRKYSIVCIIAFYYLQKTVIRCYFNIYVSYHLLKFEAAFMYVAVTEKISSVVTLALVLQFFFRKPEWDIKENIYVRLRNGEMFKFKFQYPVPELACFFGGAQLCTL